VYPYGKIVSRFPRLKEKLGHYSIDLEYMKKCKVAFPLLTREKNDFNLKEFGEITNRKFLNNVDQERKP
jgi:hypothetical protein